MHESIKLVQMSVQEKHVLMIAQWLIKVEESKNTHANNSKRKKRTTNVNASQVFPQLPLRCAQVRDVFGNNFDIVTQF